MTNPMNSQRVTTGLGFNTQLVKVVELLPQKNLARCIEPKSNQQYLVSTTMRSHMAWPQAGEYWVITRMAGPWNFTLKITSPTPPAITGITLTGSAQESIVNQLTAAGLAQDSSTHTAVPTVTGHVTAGGKSLATKLAAIGHVVDNTVLFTDGSSTKTTPVGTTSNTRSHTSATSQSSSNGNTRSHIAAAPTATDYNNLVDTVNNQNTVDNNTAASLDQLITDFNSLVDTVNNINSAHNTLVNDHNALIAQYNLLRTAVEQLLT